MTRKREEGRMEGRKENRSLQNVVLISSHFVNENLETMTTISKENFIV